MKPLAFTILTFALAAAAAQAGETIAVSDLRFRGHGANAAELTERVRESVQRALPGARLVERAGEADLTLAGSVSRGGMGYRIALELRDRNGTLVQRASATGSTRSELSEAIDGATADLLRRSGLASEESSPQAEAAPLSPIPAPLQSPAAEGALDLDADANVLVAWDRARAAEARGKESPEEAAEAWREVAEARGRNPFRQLAQEREKGWQAYAAGKRGVETQRVRDAARLREILPLASVTDTAKVDMLVRFARAYGFDRVSPLVALLPSPQLRERAELSLDCEVKEPQACVQLARAATDPKAALDYLDRACIGGAAEVCAEAGERWLSADPRDPARAMTALQTGCEAANPFACVRLARVYEEGDGAAPSPSAGAEAREKACAAGDGRSCRRLAGAAEDPARVADLLRQGCDGGDGVSCALAQKEPAIVRRQLQEAAAGAKVPASKAANTRPAVATEKPAAEAPTSAVPRSELTPRDSPAATVGALLGLGAIAGTAAYVFSSDDTAHQAGHFRRHLMEAGRSSGGRSAAMPIVLGAAAVLSTATGLAIWFTRPDQPEEPKVGLAPTGLVVSGQFR